MTKDRTSFAWNPQFPSERTTLEAPSLWRFFLLLLVIECLALVLVVPGLPKSGSIPWGKVVREAVAAPFLCWMALSHIVYWITYDIPATEDAEHNLARWRQIKVWQHQNRWGTVVLDSVILTPEPDLAERMLKLEGDPPENPGKVMALGSIEAANDGSRLGRLLDALLTPLVPALAQAAKGGLLDIVMQCDHEALCSEVISAWARLALPGKPVVRWLEHSRDVGFADTWFEDELKPDNWRTRDKAPRYRLLLAWHLNKAGPDAIHKDSEAAVAMLLGMPLLMYEKPEIKHQAWLFRQITGDADQAESLLASLLKAEQVPSKRIRHFWHSGLKGMTQHATLGAIRDSGLNVEAHALDPAIGPQAPVTRWVTQALAAKMAYFGQGAQLIALPHDQGVALNLVAKEPAEVNVPWKEEYIYKRVLGPEFFAVLFIWMLGILLLPGEGWSTADTVVTCFAVFLVLMFFMVRHPRLVAAAFASIADFVMGVIG